MYIQNLNLQSIWPPDLEAEELVKLFDTAENELPYVVCYYNKITYGYEIVIQRSMGRWETTCCTRNPRIAVSQYLIDAGLRGSTPETWMRLYHFALKAPQCT